MGLKQSLIEMEKFCPFSLSDGESDSCYIVDKFFIEKAKEYGIRCLFVELNPELTEIFGWICYVQLNDGPILIVEESDAINA